VSEKNQRNEFIKPTFNQIIMKTIVKVIIAAIMLIPILSFGQSFSSDLQYEKYGTEGEKKMNSQTTLYISPDKTVFSIHFLENDTTINFRLGHMEKTIDQYGDDNATYEITGNTGYNGLSVITYTEGLLVEGITFGYAITIFGTNEDGTEIAYYSMFYANLQ
jgi:hypothetical protein